MAVGAPLTTPDVINALKRRHSHVNSKWAYVVEFMLIDFLAVACQAADKFAVHGYEIKVSRSDWIKEMQNPDKAEPGMALCDFWYLAAPVGILKPGELPEGWGYVEVSSGRSVLKVKPTRLRPAPERKPTLTPNQAMIDSPEWRERAMFAQLARQLAYERADREAMEALLAPEQVVQARDVAARQTNRLTSRQRQAMKDFQADQRQRRSDEKVHFKHRDEGVEYAAGCPYGWCAQFASMDPDTAG